MRCYCNEENSVFTFFVENVESSKLEEAILHAAWQKNENSFSLSLWQPTETKEKELISKNFAQHGESMFNSLVLGFNWQKPLDIIAQKFNENEIEWYVVGSVSDVVRGIKIQPHDIDIVVHTKDFQKAKNICYTSFTNTIISPFVDNTVPLPLRYFGRLFLGGALVEIASDESWNMENRHPNYEKYTWNNHVVYLESLSLRYQIEVARDRKERLQAFEQYMNDNLTK